MDLSLAKYSGLVTVLGPLSSTQHITHVKITHLVKAKV